MTKHKIVFINILVLLCLLLTGRTSANTYNFNWKEDLSHLSRDYNSVAYGKGTFVAVGEKGLISVSRDLKKWKDIFIKSDAFTEFRTVLFNGDIFVAAGGGNICWSKDGYSWSSVETAYVADSSKKLVISPDERILYGAIKGKTFVLSGHGFLAYSNDGVKWTKHPNALFRHGAGGGTGLIFSNVIYDADKFVTICTRVNEEVGENKNFVYTSKDGMTWETKEFSCGKYQLFTNIDWCSENKYYYITTYDYVTQKNITFQSKNLTDWEISKVNLADSSLANLENLTYKLGDGIYHMNSDNTKFITEYKTADTEKINAICKGNGTYVAVGTNGLILFKDKKNKSWLVSRTSCFEDIYSAASNKTLIVAVGKHGQIIKSTNGSQWSIVKTDIKNSLHSIIYDGKSFIAVGDNGTIAVSADGSVWIQSPIKTAMDLLAVKKLNKQYFAVGKGATILTSNDLKSWKLVCGVEKDKMTASESFSGVTWNSGVYYAISNINSFVYTSRDGFNWKQTATMNGNAYTDLTYYKGKFVLAGGDISISKNMKTATILKSGYYSYGQPECIKLNTFTDFILAATPPNPNIDILFSADGAKWQNKGTLSTSDGINSIVEFKGKFYGFGNNGLIICGTLKDTGS